MPRMKKGVVRSDVLLLLTAAIWGFAFTAQRAGMDHIGPFLYTGIRFLLGAAVLVPLWIFGKKETGAAGRQSIRGLLGGGVLAGAFLFLGVTFQQIGLLYTTAGKAGFITGLYVILVPLLGVQLHLIQQLMKRQLEKSCLLLLSVLSHLQ